MSPSVRVTVGCLYILHIVFKVHVPVNFAMIGDVNFPILRGVIVTRHPVALTISR